MGGKTFQTYAAMCEKWLPNPLTVVYNQDLILFTCCLWPVFKLVDIRLVWQTAKQKRNKKKLGNQEGSKHFFTQISDIFLYKIIYNF